ncbi:MAG TPA: DUF503 domain-containing protein [Actinomycetota bacterium]|nr:DUF503 domain-containing protein [Actinomycetota bacterium]
MFIGFARFDLRLPQATSLKDKRSVIRTLSSMLHQKFRCAFAEVEHQDLRQRAAIGVSVISATNYHARQVLSEIGRHVETHPGVEVITSTVDVLSEEDFES